MEQDRAEIHGPAACGLALENAGAGTVQQHLIVEVQAYSLRQHAALNVAVIAHEVVGVLA